MHQCHRRFLFGLFILLIHPARAEDVKNHAGPYRPYSDDLKRTLTEFDGLDEAAFAKLSLDDPLLKRAYVSVFMSSKGDGLDLPGSEPNPALTDMRRRGDSVTPMLLKLMTENQETGFEACVLVRISSAGTIKVEPYLEYARNLLRERTQTMSASLAGSASILLAAKGTKEDAELMEWVMKTRPFVADSVTRNLDELHRRLNLPKQDSRPPQKEGPTANDPPAGDSRSEQRNSPVASHKNEQNTTRWIALALAFLVVCGLLRQVLRTRK